MAEENNFDDFIKNQTQETRVQITTQEATEVSTFTTTRIATEPNMDLNLTKSVTITQSGTMA